MCVESEDFCNMIYLLRKDAFIPSADTVKNYIITFYEDSHKKIALILGILMFFNNNIFIN